MKKLIIANWKMRLDLTSSLDLAKQVKKASPAYKGGIGLCPSYLALPAVAEVLKGSKIVLGAQDSALTDFGPYTGEVSPVDLKGLGVKYVILGHSERREHFHENSAVINPKIIAALHNGLTPILCVGEKLIEKEQGRTKNYLSGELRHALKGVKIKRGSDLIIAYEPVWAISTNKAARSLPAEEAEIVQKFIKNYVAKILKKKVRVLYGGSVNSQNATSFLKQKDIDGLLVGSASLDVQEFSQICSL